MCALEVTNTKEASKQYSNRAWRSTSRSNIVGPEITSSALRPMVKKMIVCVFFRLSLIKYGVSSAV